MKQAMSEAGSDFNRIDAEFRPKVRRYLARLVGEAEAEDLTQEVLLKISHSLDTFRGESNLSTWIYRIATNAALDRLRAPAFRQTTEQLSLDDAGMDQATFAESDSTLPAPEQRVQRKERYECYCDFIQHLPANYRTVVALSELQELAVQEIADLLGLSVDVVKIRLHRGRMKLVKALKEHCSPEDWL